MNGTIVNLLYAPVRIYRLSSGGVFREDIPLLLAKADLTCDFNNEVAWMAIQLPKLLSALTLISVGKLLATELKRLIIV